MIYNNDKLAKHVNWKQWYQEFGGLPITVRLSFRTILEDVSHVWYW